MNIIVSKHAVDRYRSRCVSVSRSRAKKILQNIVRSNGLIPYFNPSIMYCKSKIYDVALILTTNDDGDVVVKTVMTTYQFNQQKEHLKKLKAEKNDVTDINILMALGNYNGDISVNTHVKLGE